MAQMNMVSNYYRRITELLPTRFKKIISVAKKNIKLALTAENLKFYLSQFILLFSLLLFIFLSIFAFFSYLKHLNIQEQRVEIQKNLSYWEDIIQKHPNLPDAYYNAAIYAVSLNKKQKATSYIEKAIKLDPEFVEAKKFEENLGLN